MNYHLKLPFLMGRLVCLITGFMRQILFINSLSIFHLSSEGSYLCNGTVGVAEILILRQTNLPSIVFVLK
jgi:hypothetical protein